MKRIMKISFLTLLIYCGGKSDLNNDLKPDPQPKILLIEDNPALNASIMRAQDRMTRETMEQVAALKREMDQLHQGSETMDPLEIEQRVQRCQQIDGKISDQLRDLSYLTKKQMIAEFKDELETRLETGDLGARKAYSIIALLFGRDTSYFAGMDYCIGSEDLPEYLFEYDKALARKLRQITSSYDFQKVFTNFATANFVHRNHVLSVCRFLCFAMTGMTIQECIEQSRPVPNREFISEMQKIIKDLFPNEPGLDALCGTCHDATLRLFQIEKGILFSPKLLESR